LHRYHFAVIRHAPDEVVILVEDLSNGTTIACTAGTFFVVVAPGCLGEINFCG